MIQPYQMLLAFILTSVPGDVVSETEQCKILGFKNVKVNESTSKFTFKLIYNLEDEICSGKVEWSVESKSCNGMNPAHKPYCSSKMDQPWCLIGIEGKWKFKMRGISNYSECFSVPGTSVKPELYMLFMDTGVHLYIKPDQRVKSWKLEISEVSQETKTCSFPKKPKRFLGPMTFQGPEKDIVSGIFSQDKSYCFQLSANGYGVELEVVGNPLRGPYTPFCTKRQPPIIAYVDHSGVITSLAVVAAFLAVIYVALLFTMRQGSHVKIEPCQELRLPEGSPQDVLVMYAQEEEESHLQQVDGLIKELRESRRSKIYDIHKHVSQDFFEDCNHWLWQRIERGRILLILSPTLKPYLNAVFSSTEKINGMKPLLVYGLKMIVERNDYSKIFVASFLSKDLIENDEDFSNLITSGRRYILPGHLKELKTHMMIGGSRAT